MPVPTPSSLVLFSGGIDSTTALYWARRHRDSPVALTLDYGQRHRIEIRLARRLTALLGVEHQFLKVDLSQIGGSALTDKEVKLPEYDRIEDITSRPPPTYVPFRNGIFLALTAAWGETRGIKDIVCGFNIIDSPHYPDTREEFIRAMEAAINQGTSALFSQEPFSITAPFVRMKKSDIIREGISLGADYSYSVSCYSGREIPCLRCSSCLLRKRAWEDVGEEDPLVVRLRKEGKL